MLHEILLALSGHQSPLLERESASSDGPNAQFPLLSAAEQELLHSLGQLSPLHRDIRTGVKAIHATHKSSICKAVASNIQNVHLAQFQREILRIEASILKQHSSTVGAYKIVPLATIVGEFSPWQRLLSWLCGVVGYMLPPDPARACSGPDIINRLRSNAQTGYADVQQAAIQLSTAAEAAWLRQLAHWILYGQLPGPGASDFFIRPSRSGENTADEYEINAQHVPIFVTSATANSILYTGKALHQITCHSRVMTANLNTDSVSPLDLLPTHQRALSQLRLPISSPHLSEAVELIRASLSQKALKQLLPIDQVYRLLALLRRFFLLEQGEFAISLIQEANDYLSLRTRQQSHLDSTQSLPGLVIKDNEISSILAKTWTQLAIVASEDDADASDTFDFARRLMQLVRRTSTEETIDGQNTTGLNRFSDLLLPVPTKLHLEIVKPFDLFISRDDVELYSGLNAYLIALRRGQMHLSSLWKQSTLRRSQPAGLAFSRSNAKPDMAILQAGRSKCSRRNIQLRSTWATASAAIYLLNELSGYFEGQVMAPLWSRLVKLVRGEGDRVSNKSHAAGLVEIASMAYDQNQDPAMLAAMHRHFLSSLSRAVLFNDAEFTGALASLLSHIDQLHAHLSRLQKIWHNQDLEQDSGLFDGLADFDKETQQCQLQLDRARNQVDSASRLVVARLGALGRASSHPVVQAEAGVWNNHIVTDRHAKLEWLLIKLDFSNPANDSDATTSVDEDK